jgi:hypothetical protein
MIVMRIPRYFTPKVFKQQKRICDSRRNVSITIPEDLSEIEVEQLFEFLLPTLPNRFAFWVLGDIAESYDVPMPLLERLFDYGDTGCNVTICLKDDLSQELLSKCALSEDDDVTEHFLARQAYLREKQAK